MELTATFPVSNQLPKENRRISSALQSKKVERVEARNVAITRLTYRQK
jgi:hypothetical protein